MDTQKRHLYTGSIEALVLLGFLIYQFTYLYPGAMVLTFLMVVDMAFGGISLSHFLEAYLIRLRREIE